MKMNKVLGLGLTIVLSLGCLVGCNKTEEQKMIDNNEIFIKKFSKAINERWDENKENDKKLSEGKITESESSSNGVKSIRKENEKIKEALLDVTDEELKEVVENYIEGNEIQIKYLQTTDGELMYEYYVQFSKLRKVSLVTLVEEYGAKVNEEHMDTYEGFKDEAIVIEKNDEAKEVLDKIARECLVEKKTDEWGNVEYVVTFENNSDISFNLIQYDVNNKNKEAIVIGNDFISLTNFDSNTKQQVTLFGYIDGIEDVVITTNEYFEVK